MSDRSDGAGHGAGPTSGTVELDTLDVTLLALFAGWAAAEDVRQRLESRGFEGIRFGDGLIFQHLVGADRTITELATRMEVTQQAASKAVADLQRRGWISLRVDPADARARRVALSERGIAAVEASRIVRAELVAELAAECGSTDLAAARRVLSTMIGRVGGEIAVRSRRVMPPA